MAKAAGCSKFLKDLKENFLLDTVTKMIKKNQSITVFCPIDESYERFLRSTKHSLQHIKNTMIHHITTRFGKHGMTFKSLLNKEKMTMLKKDVDEEVSLSFPPEQIKLTK